MNGMGNMVPMVPVITDGIGNMVQLTQMVSPMVPTAGRAMAAFDPQRGPRDSHRTGSGFNNIGYDTTDGYSFQQQMDAIPISYTKR